MRYLTVAKRKKDETMPVTPKLGSKARFLSRKH